jgi:hypothetical protein
MRESNIEGVANHDGPESCAGTREGAGEALTGVRPGRVTEPRNHIDRSADVVHLDGRQHGPVRMRKHVTDPARSKTPGMGGISMRENREVPWLPDDDGTSGRTGKAKARRR